MPPRLIRCGRADAEMIVSCAIELPDGTRTREQVYAKVFKCGDFIMPTNRASSMRDMMGTETDIFVEFGKAEVTWRITETPGPDRLNPYQVIIHDSFGENRSGTIDGTKYEITWTALDKGPG
jgi:hypothetical protein